jgi:hypothetical protein
MEDKINTVVDRIKTILAESGPDVLHPPTKGDGNVQYESTGAKCVCKCDNGCDKCDCGCNGADKGIEPPKVADRDLSHTYLREGHDVADEDNIGEPLADKADEVPDVRDSRSNHAERFIESLREATSELFGHFGGQDDENTNEAPVSDQLAGIILLIGQLVKGEFTDEKFGIDLLRQFYEYDTGHILRPGKLKWLIGHPKVAEYADKIKPNIDKHHERIRKTSLKYMEEMEAKWGNGEPYEATQVIENDHVIVEKNESNDDHSRNANE